MSDRARTTVIAIAVALAVIAGIVGFVVREPVERALFLRSAQAMTGLDIAIGRLDHDGAGYVLENVRASVPGGSATLEAPQARVAIDGHTVALELDRPHVAFDAQRYRDADRARARDAFAAWHPGDAAATVTLRNGTLDVAAGDRNAAPLHFDGASGTLHVDLTRVGYDVALQFVDGRTRYPIAGTTVSLGDGSLAQRWTAAALPLRPFDALHHAASPYHVLGGTARDVTVDDDGALHATLHLQGARVALGEHTLAGLHGALIVERGALGSRRLVATLDRVPFEAAGEIHDLGTHYRWLHEGTPDLEALAKLATSLAGEPNLRSVRVEATAPGLAYAQYAMQGEHGPLAVSVLAMNPHEPTLYFDTALAENHIISGGERTSAMGLRTHAVGGVNGDYFDIGRTYQPQGMLVKSGTLVRGPTDRAALSIGKNGRVTFAEFHLRGRVRFARGTMPVTEFNDWPPGDVSVITPDYGKTLRAAPADTFVGLRPLDGIGKRFRVTEIRTATDALPVHFGIGIGPLVKGPLPRVGDAVTLEYRTDPPLDGARAAIGGGPILLRGGAWFEDPHAPAPDERNFRWPVVALARLRDERLMLVAVDGRHPERSVGMMRPEFGDLLLRLGATDAMALDSGGSVTLVARAPGDANVSVRNVPSDHSAERWVSDALFLYSSAPAPTIVPVASAPTPLPEARPSP